MNINDNFVLEFLNIFIATKRLSKVDRLQIVKIASISKNFSDLEENLYWEEYKSEY